MLALSFGARLSRQDQALAKTAMYCGLWGVDCLGDRDEQTRSTLERRMGYESDSAAAERSDGYKLGSAFLQ